MYLAGFNFNIKYQVGKRNLANIPLRRLDYTGDKFAEKLEWLPVLKNKMAMVQLIYVEFATRIIPEEYRGPRRRFI